MTRERLSQLQRRLLAWLVVEESARVAPWPRTIRP